MYVIKRLLTGCMYWPGMPTAFTRPGTTAAALAAAPAPDDARRFGRCLFRLRPVPPGGRYSSCCSFGSIIGGSCSSILLSCWQQTCIVFCKLCHWLQTRQLQVMQITLSSFDCCMLELCHISPISNRTGSSTSASAMYTLNHKKT